MSDVLEPQTPMANNEGTDLNPMQIVEITMEQLLPNEGEVSRVLKQVIKRLEAEQDKLRDMVDEQTSIVGVMLNVVPVSTKIAEEVLKAELTLISLSMPKEENSPDGPTEGSETAAPVEASTEGLQNYATSETKIPPSSEGEGKEVEAGTAVAEDAVVVPHDLNRFIEIVESYVEKNAAIRDLLRTFEKSFVPLNKDLLEQAGKIPTGAQADGNSRETKDKQTEKPKREK